MLMLQRRDEKRAGHRCELAETKNNAYNKRNSQLPIKEIRLHKD